MAFAAAGLEVVVADVSPDSLMLDQGSVENLISERTAAIVAVHLFGQRMTTQPLQVLARSCGALLIEDCAHRIDLLDRPPTAPDICCYSFNAVKEAPAGEGGLLWSGRSELQKRARALSNVGLDIDTLERSAELQHLDYRWTMEVGLKLRLNDVAAALTLGALDLLPSTRADRAEAFSLLDHELSCLAPLGVAPLARMPDDSYLMYVLRVPAAARDCIRRGLADRGIATSLHYPSLSRHPLWGAKAHCHTAEEQDRRIITLPCPPQQAPAVREIACAVRETCEDMEAGE